jgi:hypothetical protein
MGWASGSALMVDIINAFENNLGGSVSKTRALKFYRDVILAFEDADCDTLDECLNLAEGFDLAMYHLHPSWFEEDLS